MRSLLTYGLVAVLGIPLAGALQGCASAKHAERDPVLSGPTVQVYESAGSPRTGKGMMGRTLSSTHAYPVSVLRQSTTLTIASA